MRFLEKQKISQAVVFAALLCGAFLIYANSTQAALTLPTTACDEQLTGATHLSSGATLEEGTKIFSYGENNVFVSKTGNVLTFNITLLTSDLREDFATIKLLALDQDCNQIGGFGAGFTNLNPAALNVLTFDADTNLVALNELPNQQLPFGFPRYVWVEVWNGYLTGSLASYSYLIDITDPQNPTGTIDDPEEPLPDPPADPEEPLPAPEVRLTPDPVIIIPGILGSAQKDGVWMIDPILHTYDDLIDTLKANGYQQNYDLFTFPYDWRQSNTISALELEAKINQVQNVCECDRVDLVAHSMGGLLARQYIQSARYGNDVEQLIFLGTPHLGAPKAYLSWEGGEISGQRTDLVMKRILTVEGNGKGYKNTFDYIRNNPISSVQELLPIYDYLKDSEGNLKTYPTGYPQNTFLENLDNTLANLDSSNVNITNIVGLAGEDSTISFVRTEESENLPWWEHGYPEGFYEKIGDQGLEKDLGDGTVPNNSGSLITNDRNYIQSEHNVLPTKAEALVYNKLTGNEAEVLIDNDRGKALKLLILKMLSPADMLVIAPDGKKIGKDFETGQEVNEIADAFYSGFLTDDEFITILNPLNGEYQVVTQGTGAGGAYTVSVGYITDNDLAETEFAGTAVPDETANLILTVNNEVPQELNLDTEEELPAVESEAPTSVGGGGSYAPAASDKNKEEISKEPETEGKVLGESIYYIDAIKNGDLILDINDGRTIYMVINDIKHGFVSEEVFLNQGFSYANVKSGDLSAVLAGEIIDDLTTIHPEGTVVTDGITIWLIKDGKRYGLPSMEVMQSYKINLDSIVIAHENDLSLKEEVLSLKDW